MDNKNKKKNINITKKNYEDGVALLNAHPIFKHFNIHRMVRELSKETIGKNVIAYLYNSRIERHVYSNSMLETYIYINKNILLSAKQWAYVLAHCYLHLVFGHMDLEKVPGYMIENEDGTKEKKASFDRSIWNMACDIYVNRFLNDIKLGEALVDINLCKVPINLKDEISIYNYLKENKYGTKQIYGVADEDHLDMCGLENSIVYEEKKYNIYTKRFVEAISYSATDVIADISENSNKCSDNKFNIKTLWGKAALWFLNNYPLLGGLAASFKIIDDKKYANQYNIDVAAIDVENKEIIINPVCDYTQDEWQFILAHEYLHAGLCHQERCQGRNPFLWNVACDYVINGWLKDMQVGIMPHDGLLYDEKLKNMSAENIYDDLVINIKKYLDLKTFRGQGSGDILDGKSMPTFKHNGITTLDDFCREALSQGLEYHNSRNRGHIPAGLVEEIRALAMPAIPWDVKLAKWFDKYFCPIEKHRTYARPSRRQSATPNIPRPRYERSDINDRSRTFGVVIDTSGSMSSKDIGMALGSIASYSDAKDVYAARVIFCDADAYDAGYMCPSDIAGKVKIKGRGGTILQPGVNMLINASDFPKDGPILIITDGDIENNMTIKRDHAFLIPKGKHLPFRAKGEIFYYSEK